MKTALKGRRQGEGGEDTGRDEGKREMDGKDGRKGGGRGMGMKVWKRWTVRRDVDGRRKNRE